MDSQQNIKRAYESLLAHDFEQAIERFECAVKQEPLNASYHHMLSITCARSGKLSKAIWHAKLASQLDAREEYSFHLQHVEALLYGKVAEKLLEQGETELSVAYLKKASVLDPLSIEIYILLSIAYAGQRKFGRALQALHEVLKLDPHHEQAHYYKATYEQQLQNDL